MIFCYLFCYLSAVLFYVSSLFLYVFCNLWHCNLQDELISPEGWDIRTISFLLTTDTVKALAKLLDKVICFEEGCYLGITREMGVPDIVRLQSIFSSFSLPIIIHFTFSRMQSYIKFIKTQRKALKKMRFRRVSFSIPRIITLLISIVRYY